MQSEHLDTYVGGPLDGQPAINTTNRWTAYRDDAGNAISARDGDREWKRSTRSRYYALIRRATHIHYLHATTQKTGCPQCPGSI